MAQVSPTEDPNASKAGVVGKFTDFLGTLANTFDRGLEIYKGVNERVTAIRQINEESVPDETVKVSSQTVEEQSFFNKTDNRSMLIYGALGIAAIALILTMRR